MLKKIIDVYYGMNDNDYFRIDSRTLFSAIYYSYAEYITNPYFDDDENIFNGLTEIEKLCNIINNSDDDIITFGYNYEEIGNDFINLILNGLYKKFKIISGN